LDAIIFQKDISSVTYHLRNTDCFCKCLVKSNQAEHKQCAMKQVGLESDGLIVQNKKTK